MNWRKKRGGYSVNRKTIKRLFDYLLNYKYQFVVTTFILLIAITIDLYIPYLIKIILDNYIEHSITNILSNALIGLVILIILSGLLNFGHEYIFSKYTLRLVQIIRNDLVQYLNRQPKNFFDKIPPGDIINKLTNESMQIKDVFDNFLGGFIVSLLQLIGLYIALFLINPLFGLLSLGIPIVFMTVNYIINKPVHKYITNIQEYLNKINILFVDIIKNFSLVKLNNAESQINSEYVETNHKIYRNMLKRMHTLHLTDVNLNGLLQGLVIASMIWYFGGSIIEGSYSIGLLYLLIDYIRRIFALFKGMNGQWVVSLTALEAANRVFSVYDNNQVESKNTIVKKIDKGNIVFSDVYFNYQENQDILKKISFSVSHGEKVAIVGPSGSGKSSILSLLLKFYAPGKGKILIDNNDITLLNTKTVRNQISYVDQHSYEFELSYLKELSENQWNKCITILEKLGSAKLTEKIRKQGFASSNNNSISTGEKQILAIAVALLKDTKIIILDEATSSQDYETERKIFKKLVEETRDKTLIMVTHRLTTVKDADKIFVLNKGIIEEGGTYRELIKKKGFFYKLTALQTKRHKVLVE
ncbi:ABC transporter ATP-binding protein [Oceanobacillus profundus]|uniref:ABC transporter ATP-binding protein n=1 Tax=Oceanobacillus profundus TaxID=372463 RepID=A0A417YI81_9BACI|nr:ABC transporter ATP-binding protein [Oceanobacillus profundus]